MRREFLHSRRARLSPDDVGLPSTGRRGTPGLRREEVAALAGVSASWYTWLEQGRDIKVSDGVLDAVSKALRLSPIEREHLYLLTDRTPPHTAPTTRQTARLARLAHGWHTGPAYVLDHLWTVVAANSAARAALGVRVGRNRLTEFFTDPAFCERHRRWRDTAELLISEFRAQSARFPDDQEAVALVRDLSTTSPVFRELWRGQRITDGASAVVEVRRDDDTQTRLLRVALGADEHGDASLVVYSPANT